MLLASNMLSKEENDKTIEFLLAKPVTRNTIIKAKTLCVLFYITLLNIVLLGTDYLAFQVFKKVDFSISSFLLIHLGGYLMQLTFAAIGLLISVFVVKSKAITPIVLGVVIGTFFISIVSGVSEKLSNLKYLTPFKYGNASDIIASGKIDTAYLIIMFFIIIVSVVLTFRFYNSKNISV